MKAPIFGKGGYAIHLQDRTFDFNVIGPENEYLKRFPTFAQAEQWITTELREAAKENRRALALEAITDAGEDVLLIGVNVNTGKLKLKTDSNYAGTLYPNLPRLKKLICDLYEARERGNRISRLIDGCAMRHYLSGRLESANYDNYLTHIEESFKKATEAAMKLENQP